MRLASRMWVVLVCLLLACVPPVLLAQTSATIDAPDGDVTPMVLEESASEDAPPPGQGPRTLRGMDLRFLGSRFGWSDQVVGEAHTPLWVELTSDEGVVSGFVRVRYAQDTSQQVECVVGFTTSPGKTTRVEVPVCLPAGCDRLRLDISDGSSVSTIEFDQSPDDQRLPMPPILRGFATYLLVGKDGARFSDSFDLDVYGKLRQGTGEKASLRAIPWRSDLTSLPTAWVSYESISMVVASEDELLRADPRARDALRAWVGAGGRLLLFAGGAGERWRELLPVSTLGLAGVSLGDQRTQLVGDVSLVTRLSSLDARAQRAGWTTLSGVSAVSGPAGLGWATVVGVAPGVLETRLGTARTRTLFREWARTGSSQMLSQHVESDEPYRQYWQPVPRRQWGMSQALSGTVSVQPVGVGLMLAILSCVGLLGVAVGPIGRALVRRTVGLSRSWLFSLVCVGIATVLALVLPRVVRDGRSQHVVVETIDAICGDDGVPQHAWSNGVVGFFAGKGTTIKPGDDPLTPAGERDDRVRGEFVRGFAPTENWYWSGQTKATIVGAPLRLALEAPTLGSLRGHSEARASVSQWNFRAFARSNAGLDAAGLPLVRVRAGRSRQALLMLDGLPAGEELMGAQVLTNVGASSSVPITQGEVTSVALGKVGSLVQGAGFYHDASTRAWGGNQPTDAMTTPWGESTNAIDPVSTPHSSGLLGICEDRTWALDTIVRGGVIWPTSDQSPSGYACVIIHTSRRGSPKGDTLREERVYRVLTPVLPAVGSAKELDRSEP